MLYFDHCASTPPYEDVITSVTQVMERYYGNPSSIHQLGMEAEKLLTKARENISTALGVQPEHVIFTSGGTESNNLAVKGTARQYQHRGKHLITTQIEHSSVYECFKQLEHEGFEVTYLPVNSKGIVELQSVRDAIREDTILISVMHVNNEVGSIQPIQQIASLLQSYPKILFHVDAVQSIGRLSIYPQSWGIDMVTISAHKIRGPKGVGCLIRRPNLELQSLLSGGGQEYGLRAGTENVPFVVGMAKAMRLTMEQMDHNRNKLRSLRQKLIAQIEQIPQLILNSSKEDRYGAPHIVHFSFPGMKSEVFVHALESHGIITSTRSACSSGEQKPSRVLEAMGRDREQSVSGVRISLSAEHRVEHLDELCHALRQVTSELSLIKQ